MNAAKRQIIVRIDS